MDTSTAPSYQGCRFPAAIIAHCVWLYFRFCLSFRDVQEMMLERGVEVSHEGTVNSVAAVLKWRHGHLNCAKLSGCRFPVEIIAHCVWLYFRFCLSFRDVQEMMLECGVEVSHEGIRLWTLKFGLDYARGLRRGGRGYGDTWHVDEVFCKINGQLVYLWRAVDQDGETLDILVQKRRNARAAKRFLRKLLKGLHYVPRAMVTDKLSSYCAARNELLPAVEHRRGGRLNNRVENSHQPTRERERCMRRFKSMCHAQRFLSVHAAVSNHFRPCRHRLRARHYRETMHRRFAEWRAITGAGLEDRTTAQ